MDSRYIRMAKIWAENSYCVRRQVGALIVKDKMIISDGYNGTPSGFENVCEDEAGKTKPYVLHAEANAIISASRDRMLGADLYLACIDPASGEEVFGTCCCSMCKRLVINAGIARVFVRTARDDVQVIDTGEWIDNDDSLTGNTQY